MKNGNINIMFSVPLVWTVLEIIRERLFSPLPLGSLGYSQANYPFIIQSADILSVYGISFFIVLGNTVIYLLLSKKYPAFKVLGLSFIIFLIFSSYNIYGLNKMGQEALELGLIQSNISQERKWDKEYREQNIQLHLEPSMQLDQKVDLLIWPESAIPVDPVMEEPGWEKIISKLSDLDSPLFVGILHGWGPDRYNSSFLLRNGNFIENYKKNWLVPFGEYIPLPSFLGWIDLGFVYTNSGNKVTTFNHDDYSWASPICYEILKPSLLRRMSKDADFLLHLSNEAWFKESLSLQLLWAVGVLRAVELRRPLVKVANTGYSGYVNLRGEVETLFPSHKHYYGTVSIEAYNKQTLYSRFALLPLFIIMIIFFTCSFFYKFNK